MNLNCHQCYISSHKIVDLFPQYLKITPLNISNNHKLAWDLFDQ